MSPVHFEVLGDETLRVSGEPTAVAVTDEYILVSSTRFIAMRAGTRSFWSDLEYAGRHRVVVFDRTTLGRIADVDVAGPVNSILPASDGSFALLACGNHNNGEGYTGAILVLDLASFSWRKLVNDRREFRDLKWIGPQVATVVASPHGDAEQHRTGWRNMSLEVPSNAQLDADFLGELVDHGPAFPARVLPSARARRTLSEVQLLTGNDPSVRHPITDLRADRSGAVYACGRGVVAECWSAEGALEWRVEGGTLGGQVALVGDHVLALASGRDSAWWADETTIAARLFAFTERGVLVDAPTGFDDAPCALLLTSTSGGYLVRASAHPPYQHLPPLTWISSPEGFTVTTTLEEFRGYTDNVDFRGSEDHLIVTSPPPSTVAGRTYPLGSAPPAIWRVSAVGNVEKLFDLHPGEDSDATSPGSHGLMIRGQSVLIQSLRRFGPEAYEVLARAYPSGAVLWTTPVADACTGIAEWGEDLVAADASGLLTGMDPETGAVRWTHDVVWNDAPAVVTAIDACGDWLAVGISEGLVLRTRRSSNSLFAAEPPA